MINRGLRDIEKGNAVDGPNALKEKDRNMIDKG